MSDVLEIVNGNDAAVATRITPGSAAELVAIADSITALVLKAGLKYTQESASISDSQVVTTRAAGIGAETVSVLESNSAFRYTKGSAAETAAVIDVPLGTVIPLSTGSPFDYSGIAVFADAEAPVAGSLPIGGGTTTTATITEIISIADSNLAFVNVIPPPPIVVARDHDGVSHQPYPKRHKYKVPDLIAAELHRRNKLRSQIEDVMLDASYLPNLLGRSNKIVQLPAKAAKAVVAKLDQLPSSPERISDLSKLIVSLRHRAPNDDEEAMNLILQNLWKQ